MQNNNNYIRHKEYDSKKLPVAQQIILALILFGYPLLSLAMHYISPPSEKVIESRIFQVYIPALFMQSVIFLSIIMVILKTPYNSQHDYWNISKSLQSLGIKYSDISFLNLVIGVIFLFAAIIILNIISNIINYYGFFELEDITYLLPRSNVEKIFWVALSLSAGITEEICFRGFVITRITKLCGSVWPGVILGSVCFGLGHLYQGLAGALLITLYGLMFSLLFLARGSLIPCIVAHSLQDLLAAFAV